MRIRNTRFRFVPGQNGRHQSAFCQGAATTFRAGVTLPDRQEGDDRTGRGISDQEHARLKKTRPKVFRSGSWSVLSGADLPLRKGGYFSEVLIGVSCVLRLSPK
jgi:hypothetical protein